MEHVAVCDQLRELSLGRHHPAADQFITIAGWRELTKLKHLRSLKTSGVVVTDDGVAELTKLARLESLCFDIDDRGLEHLKGMKRLKRLHLSFTKITDAGLPEFEKLPQLEWIQITGTGATKSGVERLQKASRGLRVVGGSGLELLLW
jgi:hypothetical protein